MIAVTGSSGLLGGAVARRLAQSGVPQRLLVRDVCRAPRLAQASVSRCEYGDTDRVAAALAGTAAVLMVSAAQSEDRVERHKSFVDAAVRAGVQQVVYTSFAGAAADATFTLAREHWITEEYVRASGLSYTFLRNNLYADTFASVAREGGWLIGPAGQGRVAAVTRDDVAEVAATVLADPQAHTGTTYELTGPESLTLAQLAETMSRISGKDIRYQEESVNEAHASRQMFTAVQWELEAWVTTYTAIAAGELAAVTKDVERITGRLATPFDQLLQDTQG